MPARKCDFCNGTGRRGLVGGACTTCNGTGKIITPQVIPFGKIMLIVSILVAVFLYTSRDWRINSFSIPGLPISLGPQESPADPPIIVISPADTAAPVFPTEVPVFPTEVPVFPTEVPVFPTEAPTAPSERLYPVGFFIRSLDVDHNVSINNKKGMLIHVNFLINSYGNANLNIGAYFHYANGNELKAATGSEYADSANNVAVTEDFSPGGDRWEYTDYRLFIPYEAFNIERVPNTEVELEFKISFYDRTKDDFVPGLPKSYNFIYTQ